MTKTKLKGVINIQPYLSHTTSKMPVPETEDHPTLPPKTTHLGSALLTPRTSEVDPLFKRSDNGMFYINEIGLFLN